MVSNAYKRKKYKLISCFGMLHRADTSERQILKTESSLSQLCRRFRSSEMLHHVDRQTVTDVSESRVSYPQVLKVKALRSFDTFVTLMCG
jgi:hypothetical protein